LTLSIAIRYWKNYNAFAKMKHLSITKQICNF